MKPPRNQDNQSQVAFGQSYPGQSKSDYQQPFTPGGSTNQNANSGFSLPMPPAYQSFAQTFNKRQAHKRTFFWKVLLCICLLLVATVAVIGRSVFILPFFQHSNTLFPTSANTSSRQNMLTPTPTPGPEGKKIVPQEGKIFTGISIPESDNNFSSLNAFEKDTGKKTSIVLRYQAWGAKDGSQNFDPAWMNAVRQRGSIPMITWEPWESIPYPNGVNQPNYSLSNIIDGKFDTYITEWAKASKAWRSPFFLRFAPEMNGDWAPWSEQANGNSPGDFVKAWKHVHDIFTANNIKNVTWIWCPNINYVGGAPLADMYPGDDYVDWTAMDGFNWGAASATNQWLTFSQVFGPTYRAILAITDKPMMIAETGSVEPGGDKASWITDAYTVQLPNYFTNIKAIVWFNQVTQRDWRVESSSASLAAFSNAVQNPMYTTNSFANYIGE